MSSHNYWVIEKQKLLVDLGNYVSKDDFIHDTEIFRNIYAYMDGYGQSNLDTSECKQKDISISDFAELVKGYEYLLNLANVSSQYIALAMGMAINERDINNITVINENEIGNKKYIKYKIISVQSIAGDHI